MRARAAELLDRQRYAAVRALKSPREQVPTITLRAEPYPPTDAGTGKPWGTCGCHGISGMSHGHLVFPVLKA